MSVIKKKPIIEEIVGNLNATQVATLQSALNATTSETYKSLVNGVNVFSAVNADSPTDIGAYQVQLDAQKVRNGIAVRVYDSVAAKVHEHLLVYGESQKITVYELNTANGSYKLIDEFVDINEVRRVVGDVVPPESGPVVCSSLEVEGDAEIDGTIEAGDVGATLSNKIAESLVGVFADIKDTVPASPTATGVKGDLSFDATYLYVCTGENTWKRIAWGEWATE